MLDLPARAGARLGWPAWTFGLMAGSMLVFGLFAWYESIRARRGKDPLVVPSLFRKRAFTGGLIAGLAFFSAMIGLSLVFNLYIQIGLHYSPLKAVCPALRRRSAW
jgi:hypothetical protein